MTETTEPKAITEEDHEHDRWYKDSEQVTETTLPEFVRHVLHDYRHDYGTICHAITACALAAARAGDHSDQGGITGFQAGCIMWEFLRRWLRLEGPLRLQEFSKMLYPQHADSFRSIDKDTAEWLRKEARKTLDEGRGMHPEVRKHMQQVADGMIPFGYTVHD